MNAGQPRGGWRRVLNGRMERPSFYLQPGNGWGPGVWGPTYTWLLPSPVSTSGNTRWYPSSQVLAKTEQGNAGSGLSGDLAQGYVVPKREQSSFISLPYVTQRHSVSRRCWKNGTDRVARRRFATALQSVKNTISAKRNKAKHHKTRSAGAWCTVKAQ